MKRENAPHADPVEGRGSRSTELLKGKMSVTPSTRSVSTKQQRIAELASLTPAIALTTLSHHVDAEWLREAYRRVRKTVRWAWTGRLRRITSVISNQISSRSSTASSPARTAHRPCVECT